MNYLGHLYLAGGERAIRLGNFIADHIKGIPLSDFPPRVADGIMMHRSIDYFTDSHAGLAECREMFRPGYHKYAGVVLDVVLDYFIIQEWDKLSPYPLRPFLMHFYAQMIWMWRHQPPFWRKKARLLQFILQNRLWRYRSVKGICESLDMMARYTSLPNESGFAREVIMSRNEEITPIVMVFLHDIVEHLKAKYNITPLGWDTMHSTSSTNDKSLFTPSSAVRVSPSSCRKE